VRERGAQEPTPACAGCGRSADRYDPGDVDQDVEHHEGCREGSADDEDAADVADDVGIFLGGTGSEQSLAARTTGPGKLGRLAALAVARPTGFGGAVLGDDLGFELSGSRLFRLGKGSG